MPFGIPRFPHLNLERSPRAPQRINPNHEAELRFCVCFFRDSSGVRGFCPPMCANSPICTVACTNVPFILKFRHYVFGENASEKKRAQPKAGTCAPKNGKSKWPKRGLWQGRTRSLFRVVISPLICRVLAGSWGQPKTIVGDLPHGWLAGQPNML